MGEIARKAFLAGLGAFWLTKEKIEELVSKGEEAKKEKEWLDNLLEGIEKGKEAWEERTERVVERVLDRMGLATKAQVEELSKRIKEVEEIVKRG